MNNLQFFGNGFPFENKTLEFLQNDYKTALTGLAALGGAGDYIISGLIQTGLNVSEGWILYSGELIRFAAGVKQDTFVIVDVVENKTYQNGSSNPAYTTRYARFGTGPGQVDFADLQRLPSLLEMRSLITAVVGFEAAVVIDGCVPSNISISPTTFDLSAGVVQVDGNIFSVPAYSGVYPVYIDKDGQQVTAAPSSGSYITFDPYTSQGKASVIRRSTFTTGSVYMGVALTDRFDNTGLGKWEMKGFALMNGANGTVDMRGRFPVAYDGRGSDPSNNIWDAGYNTAGATGSNNKNTTLVHGNLPELPGAGTLVNAGDYGLVKRSLNSANVTVATTDTSGSGNEPDLTATPIKPGTGGSATPFSKIPPYMVFVMAQRI